MSKGISIHIGVNSVDPSHYGTSAPLAGCENDAKTMKKIGQEQGYDTILLLTKDATSTRVLSELRRASQQLTAGDYLMLTYAGHGAQVPDTANEEQDRLDETWCLFDRMLLDDELASAWSNFQAGVNIIVISDSCHSGTVTRQMLATLTTDKIYPPKVTYRCMEPEVAFSTHAKFSFLYDGIKLNIPRAIDNEIKATVLLISGCQDNQLSGDGQQNGLFTGVLLQVWSNGTFKGNYTSFHEQICSKMPAYQTPNFLVIGRKNEKFEKQTPFKFTASRIIEGDELFINRPRIFTWSLEVDEHQVLGLTQQQLETYLKNMVEVAFVPAYQKFRVVSSQIVLPRGGEVSGGCSVSDKGWECHAGGTIRF